MQDCTGRPDNSGNKRPPRSPRGVPWLPKAADLASKFHREPPWRRPTRLVPVGSVQHSSRICLVPFGSVQRKTAQTRPINGPTRLLKVPSRISGLGMTIPDLEELGLLHSCCVYGVIRGFMYVLFSSFNLYAFSMLYHAYLSLIYMLACRETLGS